MPKSRRRQRGRRTKAPIEVRSTSRLASAPVSCRRGKICRGKAQIRAWCTDAGSLCISECERVLQRGEWEEKEFTPEDAAMSRMTSPMMIA